MKHFIDSHHHFWDPAVAEYPWMTSELAAIRRKFSPDDLRPSMETAGVTGTILVQTRSSYEESREFLAIADDTDFVLGVVAWVDLTSPDVSADIQRLKDGKGGSHLVGIRHQVHDEEDANWLLRPDVRCGLEIVADHNLTFDLLLRPRELPSAIEVVRSMPKVHWVLDHIAKPQIASRGWEPWAGMLYELAEASQHCRVKLSGMVTEADWANWTIEDLRPYVRHVLKCFGAERCMIGSDWPVSLLASPYDRVMKTALDLISDLPPDQKYGILARNASAAYRIKLEGRE